MSQFHLITCIVERSKADKVVDAAIAAGAQAATMFYARGRGVREKLGIWGILIQAEKEVILVVTKEEERKNIFDAIVDAAELKVPGKGFAYVQPVEDAVGFLPPEL